MSQLGIITALTSEALCFSKDAVGSSMPVKLNEHASLMLSGMGQEAAMVAAKQLLDNGATVLVSFGMAGALSADLRSGDILLPARVCSNARNYYSCDESWRRQLRRVLAAVGSKLYEDDIFSTTTPVADAELKKALGRDTGTIAVDMESAAIMALALEWHIPAVVLRTVIDPVDFPVPQYLLDGCNPYGEISPLYLLKSLVMNPLRSISLLQLAACHRHASSSLALCADKLIQAQQTFNDPATQRSS